jgi:hypothetical protein
MRAAVIGLTVLFVLFGVMSLVKPEWMSDFTAALGWFNAALYFYWKNS